MYQTRALILFLAGCTTSVGQSTGSVTDPPVDAGTDPSANRVFLQSLLDQGGDVTLPAGNFIVNRAGSNGYCLKAVSARVHGAGQGATTITMAGGTAGSVVVLNLSGNGASLQDLTLDGNKAGQLDNEEHRHGVMVQDGAGIRISRITAQNFTGDGVYLFHGLSDTVVEDSTVQNNNRQGLTVGMQQTGTTISGNRLVGNFFHQLDSEPGNDVITHVTVVNNVMQASPGNSAMTATGATGNPGGNWVITRNTLTGGVFIVGGHNIAVIDNAITSVDTPPVWIKNDAADIMVFNNTLTETGTGDHLSGVLLEGTQPKAADGTLLPPLMPSGVSIVHNLISSAATDGMGVRAIGALDITVTGNTIIGPGAANATSNGVGFRATIAARAALRCVVTDNTISGVAIGVGISGNGTVPPKPSLGELDVVRNSITATTGVSLDAKESVPDSLYVRGNNWNGLPVAQRVASIPATCTIISSDASTP